MLAAGIMVHFLNALRRALVRVVLWFLGVGIGATFVFEVVAYFGGGGTNTLTHVAAGIMGVALGYAAGLTVLVAEVLHALITSVTKLENDVRRELGGGSKVVQALAQGVRQVEQRL